MSDIFEKIGSIGFDGKMALIQFVNFLITFYILKKLFFAKIVKVIEERQQKFNESVTNAAEIAKELGDARSKAGAIIGDARQESKTIIEKSQHQAESMTEKMRSDTQQEVESMISKSKQQIKGDKEKMFKELREDISELVVKSTEKITKNKMDAKTDSEMVGDVIDELRK